MPSISKEFLQQLSDHHEGDEYWPLLQGLLAQPEQKPVGKLKPCREGWFVDIDNAPPLGAHETLPLYTYPAPFTPITADMVTESVRNAFLSKDVLDEAIATAFNEYMGAKKPPAIKGEQA